MDLKKGNYIGEYRVIRLVGRGSMGSVYLCENPRIRSQVAIKVLHRRHAGSEWVVDRFVAEAQVVNQIGHPGIVRIFDCRVDPEVGPYLVMEYLEGQNVKERHLELLPLPSETGVRILLQAASALSACHRAGVVHRDLKPANLFLSRDPDMPGGHRVKLLDFGVAKLIDCNVDPRVETVAGMLPGSPPYMSPEGMLDAKTIDARSDIYSLGVIGYQLLTGRFPHNADSLGRLIISRQEDKPIPPRQLNPAIPPEVERVLLTALELRPERRYQSIDLFKHDLCQASEAADRTATARTMQVERPVELLPAAADDRATVVDLGPPMMEPVPVVPPAGQPILVYPSPPPPSPVTAPTAPPAEAPILLTTPARQPAPAARPEQAREMIPQASLPGTPPQHQPRRREARSAALIGAAATLLLAAMLMGSYALL